jgi:integrase
LPLAARTISVRRGHGQRQSAYSVEILDVGRGSGVCERRSRFSVTDCRSSRATALQQKTQRPVQFEITPSTREAVETWTRKAGLRPDDYLFPSRVRRSPHLGTRQYARILDGWVSSVGLDPTGYGTHSLRRTKASLIYRRTKNLRAVQLLLGHSKLESTVRYLGIEVDDALELAEQTDV